MKENHREMKAYLASTLGKLDVNLKVYPLSSLPFLEKSNLFHLGYRMNYMERNWKKTKGRTGW